MRFPSVGDFDFDDDYRFRGEGLIANFIVALSMPLMAAFIERATDYIYRNSLAAIIVFSILLLCAW